MSSPNLDVYPPSPQASDGIGYTATLAGPKLSAARSQCRRIYGTFQVSLVPLPHRHYLYVVLPEKFHLIPVIGGLAFVFVFCLLSGSYFFWFSHYPRRLPEVMSKYLLPNPHLSVPVTPHQASAQAKHFLQQASLFFPEALEPPCFSFCSLRFFSFAIVCPL